MSNPRQVAFELELGIPQPVTVVRARVEERISQPTRALVEVATPEDLDLEPRLAKRARLSMLVDGLEVRAWPLCVAGSRFEEAKSNGLRFVIELQSLEWFLRFTQETRKFRKLSAKDIVQKVLASQGVEHEWHLLRDPPRRNYCVQYRESNLDFARRLLEFEGIYYTWSDLLSDGAGKMILADLSATSPAVPGPSHFELLGGEGAMSDGQEAIHSFTKGARVRSGKATVSDFDWKKPSTKLLRSRAADLDADLEVYDYPTGYRNGADGEHLARIRLEALRANARFATGKGSAWGFAPAHVFTFGGLAGPAFAGEYLLVGVAHEYVNQAFQQRKGTVYENSFEAIPKDVPYRPPVVTPRPNIAGHHTAMVRGPAGAEIHTDKLGRFRVQFHWDREAVGTDDDSRWLRVAQESASSMFLARVGWEMNVGYIDGDPDRPIGLSRNINGVMPPSYGQPGKKNVMTIKTPSSPNSGGFNEIRLDDSGGAMEFYVKAERDLVNLVKNDRSELVTLNDTHTVGKLLNHTVERDQTVTIGSDLSVEIEGTHTLNVGKDHKESIGGSEKLDGGTALAFDVKGNDTEKVGSVRLSIVGKVKPPNLAARAKGIFEGLIPNPREASKKVVDGVVAGAKAGFDARFAEAAAAGGGAGGGGGGGGAAGVLGAAASALGLGGANGQSLSAGAKGALSGALAGGEKALKGLIPKVPDAKSLASQLTGGLTDGITLEKIVNLCCSGNVARSGDKMLVRMVGGAHVETALGGISMNAKYAMAEIIGGAKITICTNGGLYESVTGPLATTVGGMVMRKSKTDMSYSAENTVVRVGATADWKSDQKLTIESNDVIQVTAKTKLEIAVGAATITLTPSAVKISGDLALSAPSKIGITGKKDNVTA